MPRRHSNVATLETLVDGFYAAALDGQHSAWEGA